MGSHLVERLAADGHQVTPLVEPGEPSLLPDTAPDPVPVDVRDRDRVADAMPDVDVVVHLAALLNHRSASPDAFHAVNVGGTRNVMDAASSAGADRVVHVSSKVAIAEQGGTRVDAAHRHRGRFRSVYARTKYKGEKIAFEYGARGLDTVVLNPTLIYGPREHHTLGPLIRRHVSWPVRFHAFPDATFDLVYVDDVVDALTAAMDAGRPGHRYIVGGEQVTLRRFLDTVDAAAGVDAPLIRLPDTLVSIGSRAAPLLALLGRDPPLSRAQVDAMRTPTRVDASTTHDELGIDPVPLRTGLERTIAAERDTGYL